jgi:hypothetical protein
MAGYVWSFFKGVLKFMYEEMKMWLVVIVVGGILVIGYNILTSKPLPPDPPPDNSAKSTHAPPPDTSVTKTPDTSYAQEPDTPEAYDITLRCEGTTGVTMVSVDTVKGIAKVDKVFYKDGDTRVLSKASAENDVFSPGCTVRDVVSVTDSTILLGTEAVVGACGDIKDSGTGRFAAIDRLSGAMVISLLIDDAKAGKGMFADQKPSLCQTVPSEANKAKSNVGSSGTDASGTDDVGGTSDTIVVDGVSCSRATVNEVMESSREHFSKDPAFAGNPKAIENAAKLATAAALVKAAEDVNKKNENPQ